MWKRMFILMVVTFLGVSALIIQSASGIEYPTRPIEMYVPYGPGGTNDLMTRIVADVAQKYVGQPLVVVNKPGGGGAVAAGYLISSKPDGYKMVSLATAFLSSTIYTQKVPFGPDDLVPVANFMEFQEGLIVRGDSEWKTLSDLLDYGRKNPGALRWGHPSRGSPLCMNTLLVFRKAGVTGIEVPYLGSAEVLNALLGGHIDAAAQSYGVMREQLRAGKVRYLASFCAQRFKEPSNIPTAAELGFPEATKLRTFVGLYMHKDTPEDIRNFLFNAFKKTNDDPEFQKRFEKFGEALVFGDGEFIKEQIKKSREVSIPLLKEFGLYVAEK
jgi:putative tricarboxylic transport membrane protein